MKRPIFLLLFFLLFLLPLHVHAETAPVAQAQSKEDEVKEGILAILPDMAKSHLDDPTDEEAVRRALGFDALLSLFGDSLSAEGGAILSRCLLLLVITLFFGSVALFVRGSTVGAVMQSAAALAYFFLLADSAERLFSFFTDLEHFTLGLSPLFVSLFAGSGATASAGAAGAD